MRYVIALLPITSVVMFNAFMASSYNEHPGFLAWCILSGGLAGWFGGHIYLNW